MLEIANMARDFVTSVCQTSDRIGSSNFQVAIDVFTQYGRNLYFCYSFNTLSSRTLEGIVNKCEMFAKRTLLSRVVSQEGDKNE